MNNGKKISIILIVLSFFMVCRGQRYSQQSWNESEDKTCLYRYSPSDSVLFILPLKHDFINKGILNNDKKWYDYVKDYAEMGFDFTGSPNMDWDIGYVTFTTSTDGPPGYEIDSLFYSLLGNTDFAMLEAFSINTNKLNVGNLRVGYNKSKVLKILNLELDAPINSIVIGNYYYVYDYIMDNRKNESSPEDLFLNFKFEEIPYDVTNYTTWENLPYEIELIFKDEVLISIRTPKRSDGSFYSPTV